MKSNRKIIFLVNSSNGNDSHKSIRVLDRILNLVSFSLSKELSFHQNSHYPFHHS